eukprot:scaffold161751_cov17-Tisochrysis_lutea.AAC.1
MEETKKSKRHLNSPKQRCTLKTVSVEASFTRVCVQQTYLESSSRGTLCCARHKAKEAMFHRWKLSLNAAAGAPRTVHDTGYKELCTLAAN